MKALIIGATGATGKELLYLLLKDEDIQDINIFVRRNTAITNLKLNTHIIDFNNPEQWQEFVEGDVFFSCLGTTLKAAGSKEKQWQIDYDYQYEFAKAAKKNGVKTYVLISAESASSKSPFFYNKMKGELEDAIELLKFEKTIIVRPPLLERKNSNRKMEVWAAKFIKFFNQFGILKSQKPLPSEALAKAMLFAVKDLNNGLHKLHPKDIWKYVNYNK